MCLIEHCVITGTGCIGKPSCMYVETVDYTWFHLAAEGTLQSSYEVHLELFSVFNDFCIDYEMQCQLQSIKGEG